MDEIKLMSELMLYHSVPPQMIGTIIYPMNILAEMDQNLADQAEKKYIGREKKNDYHIGLLGCHRRDIVFLTTIHPKVLREVFVESGPTPQFNFFEIPLSVLDTSKMCFYNPSMQLPTDTEFSPFAAEECVDKPSAALREHIWQERAEGRRPLLAAYTQQVIYMGNIETKGLTIVTVG